MPFTVLKTSKTPDYEIEVSGEFATTKEAEDFADEAKTHESASNFEYTVETPPSMADPQEYE